MAQVSLISPAGMVAGQPAVASDLTADLAALCDAVNTVQTGQIENLAITEPKIADSAVITRTLANGVLSVNTEGRAKMADGFVTTAKLEDGAVTEAKVVASLKTIYLLFKDQKASATNGGSFTQSTWQKRDITDKVIDGTGSASLATSQITLPAGTYRCRIQCPANSVGGHQVRLRNTTASATLVVGDSQWANSGSTETTTATAVGQFTVTSGQALEIQHWCTSTQNTTGLGKAVGSGELETYTVAEFWKTA